MQSTARIDTNILTAHVRGGKRPMAQSWIAEAVRHPGALRKQAARAGKTVSQMIAHPPKGASATTNRRIALAKTLKRLRKKKTGK